MKITGVVAMAAMAGASLWAGQSAAVPEATVTVCMKFDHNIPAGTRPLVSTMFARIGVRIDWRERFCPIGVGSIAVKLSYDTPHNQLPNAIAFARPNEGAIVVFYDRVYDRVNKLNSDGMLCLLLAHVLVHEITHVLQGIDRHSATGIMKARWDARDYLEMDWKPLPFAQEDVDLIYDGLKERQTRLAGGDAAVSTVAIAGQ